jgi:hypothetical protein
VRSSRLKLTTFGRRYLKRRSTANVYIKGIGDDASDDRTKLGGRITFRRR